METEKGPVCRETQSRVSMVKDVVYMVDEIYLWDIPLSYLTPSLGVTSCEYVDEHYIAKN